MTRLSAIEGKFGGAVARIQIHSRQGSNLVTELNEENARKLRDELDELLDDVE